MLLLPFSSLLIMMYASSVKFYLGLADPTEWLGGKANLLLMNISVPPITQQEVELTIIMEWLFLSICHVHYKGPIQAS